MDDLLNGTALWLVAIAGAMVLAMLYALAALVRDRTIHHDLQCRVRRLRAEFTEQIEVVVMEEDEEITRLAREKFGGPAQTPAAKAA